MANSSAKVALYTRVSTASQSDLGQHEELIQLCERSGWIVVHIYREVVSGTKGAEFRPELKRLLIDAKHRRFDKVVVWSADRLARSMKHLVDVLGELRAANIDIFSYRQGVDTATPMGSMLWQVLGIFAEFEHGIRRERQALGIGKAHDQGVRFGRPRITSAKVSAICALRAQGCTVAAIAKEVGVGAGTVARTLAQASKQPQSGQHDAHQMR